MNPTRTESIRWETRIARSDAIVFSEHGSTVLMMDVKQGSYYELDGVSARIWALVESEPCVSEVCDALVAQYDVAPDTCGDEVRAFLEELCRLKVVRALPHTRESRSDEAPGDAARPPASAGAATPPRRAEGSARAAWTTPAVRTLETMVRRVASGPNPRLQLENADYYHPES